jgi:hypothetical protein
MVTTRSETPKRFSKSKISDHIEGKELTDLLLAIPTGWDLIHSLGRLTHIVPLHHIHHLGAGLGVLVQTLHQKITIRLDEWFLLSQCPFGEAMGYKPP